MVDHPLGVADDLVLIDFVIEPLDEGGTVHAVECDCAREAGVFEFVPVSGIDEFNTLDTHLLGGCDHLVERPSNRVETPTGDRVVDVALEGRIRFGLMSGGGHG